MIYMFDFNFHYFMYNIYKNEKLKKKICFGISKNKNKLSLFEILYNEK